MDTNCTKIKVALQEMKFSQVISLVEQHVLHCATIDLTAHLSSTGVAKIHIHRKDRDTAKFLHLALRHLQQRKINKNLGSTLKRDTLMLKQEAC